MFDFSHEEVKLGVVGFKVIFTSWLELHARSFTINNE